MANMCNYHFKFIIVGNSSVGKSNLLTKFAYNKFVEKYEPTITNEFVTKFIEIEKQKYQLQMWDISGDKIYDSINQQYYKNIVCAMVVYDITNLDSFRDLKEWIEDIRSRCPKTVLIILIGNKIDLEDKRNVSYEEGEKFAKENGFIFGETSANTGKGIEEIFNESVKKIVENMNNNYYDLSKECGIKKGRISSSKNVKTGSIHLKKKEGIKECCYY